MQKSIVIIDDDPTSNFITSKAVRSVFPEVEIRFFERAREALVYLDSAHGNFPTYILLDVNMPEMNGWEFLVEYEKKGWHEQYRTAVAMLTTSEDLFDRETAESFIPLVFEYLMKPVDKRKLEDTLTRLA